MLSDSQSNGGPVQHILKTPHYRIDDPNTSLAVQFHCEPAPAGVAPKVLARLVAPARATIFMTRAMAEDFFAHYMPGAVAEIVRVDA